MRLHISEEEYIVGYAEIDEEHRNVFKMLRELQLELYDNSEPELVKEKIFEMQSYAEKHFCDEVRIMAPYKAQIPFYAEHLQEHKSFIDTTNAFKERMQVEGFGIAEEVLAYLDAWFKNHILSMDKKSFDIVNDIQKNEAQHSE